MYYETASILPLDSNHSKKTLELNALSCGD